MKYSKDKMSLAEGNHSGVMPLDCLRRKIQGESFCGAHERMGRCSLALFAECAQSVSPPFRFGRGHSIESRDAHNMIPFARKLPVACSREPGTPALRTCRES